MKSKLASLFILYITILLTSSLFAQTSDCPPCTKDQPASPGKACCGREEYDPETHECCGDKIVEKGKCCRNGGNPTEYDPSKECCESSGVLPKDTISNLDDCPNRVANGTPPSCNGCGTDAIQVSSAPAGCAKCKVSVSFLAACNAHDYCYSTCKSNKGSCDTNFRNDMYDACTTQLTDETCTCGELTSRLNGCKKYANLYANAVGNWGTSAYTTAQKGVCKCCD